jgi:hypothetical protein
MLNRILMVLVMALVVLGCGPSKPDYEPFHDLDLGKSCRVYFILSEGDWGTFEEETKDFVIEDPEAIRRLQADWKFYKTDKRMTCGFGYLVLATVGDSLVREIDINAPCGYAVTTGGWYDFDSDFYESIDVSKVRRLTRQQADSVQSIYFPR